MATVIFYEKPDCINNKRQKKLLQKSGHEVIAYNLLDEPWTTERLQNFFQGLQVYQWFNKSAPDIKSGELNPDQLNIEQALEHMVSNPLLIARPLMQVDGQYMAGFDLQKVHNWIGLNVTNLTMDLQTCSNQ